MNIVRALFFRLVGLIALLLSIGTVVLYQRGFFEPEEKAFALVSIVLLIVIGVGLILLRQWAALFASAISSLTIVGCVTGAIAEPSMMIPILAVAILCVLPPLATWRWWSTLRTP